MIIQDKLGKDVRVVNTRTTPSPSVTTTTKTVSSTSSSTRSIVPIPSYYNSFEVALAKVNPTAARQLYERRIAQEQAKARETQPQPQPVEPQGRTKGQVLGEKLIGFVKTVQGRVFERQKTEAMKRRIQDFHVIPALETGATTYNVYTIGGKEYAQTEVEQRIPILYETDKGQLTGEQVRGLISEYQTKSKQNYADYMRGHREFVSQVQSVPTGSLFYESGEKLIVATPEAQELLKSYKEVGYVPEKGVVAFYENPPAPHEVLIQVKGETTERITWGTQSLMNLGIPMAFAGIQQAITGEKKIDELRDIYASQTLGMLPRKGEQGAIGRQLTSPQIVWDVYVPMAFLGVGPLLKGVGAIGGRLLNIGGRIASKTPAFIRTIGGKLVQIKDYKNIVYANKTILGKTVTVGQGIKAGVYGTMGGFGAYQIAQDPSKAYYTGGKMLGQLALGYASFKAGATLVEKGVAFGTRQRIAEQWTGSQYESYITANSRAWNLMESRRGTFELGASESQFADTIKPIYEPFPVQQELHLMSRVFGPSTQEAEQSFILQRPKVSTETYAWEVATPTQEEGLSITTGQLKPKLYEWKDIAGISKKTFIAEERGVRFYAIKTKNARGEISRGMSLERPIGVVNREITIPMKYTVEGTESIFGVSPSTEYPMNLKYTVPSDVTLTAQVINTRTLRLLDTGRVYRSVVGDEFAGEGVSGSMVKGGGQYYFTSESVMGSQESISSRLFPESYATGYTSMFADVRAFLPPVESGPKPSRLRQQEVYPIGKKFEAEYMLTYPTGLGFTEGVLGIQNIRRLQGREPIVDFEPVVMQQLEQASMQKVAMVTLTKQVTDQLSVQDQTVVTTTVPYAVPPPPVVRPFRVIRHTFFDNPPPPVVPLPIIPPMPQGRGTRGAGGQWWALTYKFRKADIGLPFNIDIFSKKKGKGGFAF